MYLQFGKRLQLQGSSPLTPHQGLCSSTPLGDPLQTPVIGYRARHVLAPNLTRAHQRNEMPERDVTYHLTCLLIYH